MKVAGRTIQERNITCNTEREFSARYKGCLIYCRDDGKGRYGHLREYYIEVCAPDGCYLVHDAKDLHSIRDAIIYALDGAKL